MLQGMLDVGAVARSWWTAGTPPTLEGFRKRFPSLIRVTDHRAVLDDPQVDLVLIAAVPCDRARLAIAAMEAGKDVMVDKPGCTTLADLTQLRETVARTGRIWSVNYSERFEVPAVTKALELVQQGAVGRVVQTVGLGPHRHNPETRAPWFYDPAKTGGILCDIGSHQIDQFMLFTGSTEVEIVAATSGNFANPQHPQFEDFAQLLLSGDAGQGYVRVDWYTPDALPTWGDGRLFVLGTQGTIELRKYVDVAGRHGTDHLFLVNGQRCEHIDAASAGVPYFAHLAGDVVHRTETAMAQAHCFRVMDLALRAQAMADAHRAVSAGRCPAA
ncbi:MAG: Gfo/Idh/MocA family oxidoreductase [Burkholderiales bacterium]|nr:Gfo/Idh/MocA family oxidoreductase [Burkholderiales bacterium]